MVGILDMGMLTSVAWINFFKTTAHDLFQKRTSLVELQLQCEVECEEEGEGWKEGEDVGCKDGRRKRM